MSWSEISLGEIAEFRNGLNYTKENEGNGLRVINVKDFGNKSLPNYDELGELNPHGILRGEALLKHGDIIFVRSNGNKDLVGRSLFINSPPANVSFSAFCIRARLKESDNPYFYAYFFRTPNFRKRLSLLGKGTNISNLNQQVLKKIKVPNPSAIEKARVVNLISSYDDLIENNRRRIQLLEQAARLLYKEWFVHFRFPGHEHVTIKDGVPEGWEKKPLSEITDITMGQSPQSVYYNEDGNGLPFHQGVTNFGVRFPVQRTYCTVQGRLAESGDILFSVRAPVGRINITTDKIVIGRGLAAIRSILGQQNLLFYALKSHFFKEDMIGGGAIFAAITKKDLYGVKLLQSPDSVAQMFMEHVRPIDLQIENLNSAMEKLTELRDLLLPRLMNGEVAV